mgnify:CR=1 FL=1
MFFELRNRNKTVKELRKNQGYTAQELAIKLKVDTPVILKIDHLRLKEVPPKIKSRIMPVLRGDYMNKVPW